MYIIHNTIQDLETRLKPHNIPLILLSPAMELSRTTHKNQFRDNGDRYFEGHVLPVTLFLIDYLEATGQKITLTDIKASLTHDVLEDNTDITTKEYKDILGNEANDVYTIVARVTKRDEIIDNKNNLLRKWEAHEQFLLDLKYAPQRSVDLKAADKKSNNISDKGKILRRVKDLSGVEIYSAATEYLYLPFFKKHNEYFYNEIKKDHDFIVNNLMQRGYNINNVINEVENQLQIIKG